MMHVQPEDTSLRQLVFTLWQLPESNFAHFPLAGSFLEYTAQKGLPLLLKKKQGDTTAPVDKTTFA